VQAILNSGKPIGVVFPKMHLIDMKFLRSREFLSFSKEKILCFLYKVINKNNGEMEPDSYKTQSSFHMNKFYIGKGNNSMLVRSVFKQRWWWSMNDCDNFYESNFLWTQWRKNKHVCILDTKHPVTKQVMIDLKKQTEREQREEETGFGENTKHIVRSNESPELKNGKYI
jgi:hypothetical protein